MRNLFRRAKRSGHKLYGRQIRITFPDGRAEAHLLPRTARYRDMTSAKIEFDQWGPGRPDNATPGECTCRMWRAYIWRHIKLLKPLRAAKLCALGLKRMISDGKM